MATDGADPIGNPGDGAEGLPASAVEDLLASERRRCLLAVLRRRGEAVSVEDLAAALAAGDDGDPDAVGTDERREGRLEIYQEHLPKLTATEVVRFDSMLAAVEYVGDPALEARLDAEE